MPYWYLVDTASTQPLTNSCRNPSFETTIALWGASSMTIARIAANAQAGTNVLRLSAPSSTSSSVSYTGTITAAPGESWSAACYVKNVAGLARDFEWQLLFLDSGGSPVGTETQTVNVPAGSDWQRMVAYGQAPAGTVRVIGSLYPQRTNPDAGNVAYFDAVTIIKKPASNPPYVNDLGWYFDGSTAQPTNAYYVPPGATSWAGTAHNSESTVQAGEWLSLQNVTNVDVTVGRQTDTQPFAASTASAQCRFPLGYTTLGGVGLLTSTSYTTPGAGFRVRREEEPNVTIWQGTVTDVQAEWGPVWDGLYGQADTLSITAEGAFGPWGRRYVENVTLGADQDSLETMLGNLATATAPAEWVTTHFDDPQLRLAASGSSTFTGYASEWVQKACATVAAYVRDGGGTLQLVSKYDQPDAAVEFVDTGATATGMVFDQLSSDSLRENLIQLVVIKRAVGTDILLGAGESFSLDTYTTDTVQGLALALHYLNRYSSPKFQLTSLSALAEAQDTMLLDGLGAPFWQLPGTVVDITFRGDSKTVVIEGASLTATPESSRVTYYFSAAGTNRYLILDDANLGKLDSNQLGW